MKSILLLYLNPKLFTMKKALTLFTLLLITSFGFSQSEESVQILKSGSKYKTSLIKKAVVQDAFNAFRLNSERRTVILDDGSELILLSNSELGLPFTAERKTNELAYSNKLALRKSKITKEVIVVELMQSPQKINITRH